jgi:hypothetical protein
LGRGVPPLLILETSNKGKRRYGIALMMMEDLRAPS